MRSLRGALGGAAQRLRRDTAFALQKPLDVGNLPGVGQVVSLLLRKSGAGYDTEREATSLFAIEPSYHHIRA